MTEIAGNLAESRSSTQRWKRDAAEIGGALLILMVSLNLAGCGSATRTVVIDNGHNVPWAKSLCEDAASNMKSNELLIKQANVSCDQITSCPEEEKIHLACIVSNGNAGGVFDYVSSLETALATTNECHGIRILVREDSDKISKEMASVAGTPYWEFQLNFVPGDMEQDWSIGKAGGGKFFNGQGNVTKIAVSICRIVNGTGGNVES